MKQVQIIVKIKKSKKHVLQILTKLSYVYGIKVNAKKKHVLMLQILIIVINYVILIFLIVLLMIYQMDAKKYQFYVHY